jgi:hypothetical protein
MPTTLKTRFVGVTAGLVKPSTLTWKGRIRKAPDIPPMEVKKEITIPTRGGIQIDISTPEIGKVMGTSGKRVSSWVAAM